MIAGLRARWQERTMITAVIVAVITFVVFLPALANGFVRYDDHGYVYENRVVLSGLNVDSLRWSFTTLSMSNWHPLTWLSYLVDSSVFGMNPGGFHATNVVLHALCAGLVVLVVSSLSGDVLVGAAVALLFALHPLRVESVAWISERKDVLSGVFFFVTLLCYVKAVRASSRPWHALAVAAFAFGLMSKAMLMTVPALLLVIDACFLRRRDIARALVEKLPFVVLALVAAVLAVKAQGDAIVDVETHGIAARAANAIVSIARYLAKTAWPFDLSIAYRVPDDGWSALAIGASAALVVALTLAFVAFSVRTRDPRPLGGWLWFVGMLSPVLGLVQVGSAAMAERYTYVPHIGLFLAVVLVVERVRPIAIPIAIALALACVPRTIDQIAVWSSSRTLFSHAIAQAPEHAWMRMNLASALVRESEDPVDVRLAIDEGATAIRQRPNDVALLAQFGVVLSRAGDRAEAERALRAVLEVDPNNAVAREELERLRQ
jgi:protein O-mannosyl-transferase